MGTTFGCITTNRDAARMPRREILAQPPFSRALTPAGSDAPESRWPRLVLDGPGKIAMRDERGRDQRTLHAPARICHLRSPAGKDLPPRAVRTPCRFEVEHVARYIRDVSYRFSVVVLAVLAFASG